MWNRIRKARFGNSPAALCSLGHSHPSRLESSVCQILELRRRAGEFEHLECQVNVRICCDGRNCDSKQKIEYIPDFRCTRADGSAFFVEAKGFETPVWRLKRRLWMHRQQGPLEVWTGNWSRPSLSEVIPGGASP